MSKATQATDKLSNTLGEHGTVGAFIGAHLTNQDLKALPAALSTALDVLLDAEYELWELLRVVAAERSDRGAAV